MPPTILSIDEPSLQAAVMALRCGELVAFPTETVYGLGADTRSPSAIASVYAMKGRPADNPVIAHVADAAMARTLVASWDERAETLARHFWPGPLTLVLPRGDLVPAECTAGLGTIAVRCPAHPIAQFLIRGFGDAISAPSANRSGRLSPTDASHVVAEFLDTDRLLVIDGGPCLIGIESTVIDISGDAPRILRPGSITSDRLAAAIGPVEVAAPRTQDIAPGTSASHYAPTTPLRIVDRSSLSEALDGPGAPSRATVLAIDPPSGVVVEPHVLIPMPDDPERYAAKLYAALRDADRSGADMILVIAPPNDSGVWMAIHDRLRRAAAG